MKQEDQKRLAYSTSSTHLVRIDDEIKVDNLGKKIKILFDGNPINDLTLVFLMLRNASNRSINLEDYSSSIKFSFGENAQVLDATCLFPSSTINVNFSKDSESLSVKPIFTSPEDKLLLVAMVTGYKGKITQDGCINDGEVIHELNEHEQYQKKISREYYRMFMGACIGGGALVALSILAIMSLLLSKLSLLSRLPSFLLSILFYPIALIIAIGVVVMFLSTLQVVRLKRRSLQLFQD